MSLTPKFEQLCRTVAEQCVTPERYGGAMALDDTVEMDLSELADEPLFSLAEAGPES